MLQENPTNEEDPLGRPHADKCYYYSDIITENNSHNGWKMDITTFDQPL